MRRGFVCLLGAFAVLRQAGPDLRGWVFVMVGYWSMVTLLRGDTMEPVFVVMFREQGCWLSSSRALSRRAGRTFLRVARTRL